MPSSSPARIALDETASKDTKELDAEITVQNSKQKINLEHATKQTKKDLKKIES